MSHFPTSVEAHPNPFNAITEIRFELGAEMRVDLMVYDLLGRVVATLADGEFTAGEHRVSFDATALASGVYFYRLEAGDIVQTKKMMLIR